MSPTGSGDFNAQPTASPTSNQGETANRVLMAGGSNSQSGRWLWASGFESGLGEWSLTNTTTGASITKSNVYQGAAACLLRSNGVANHNQGIFKKTFTQGNGRYGLEAMVLMQAIAGENKWITFQIQSKHKSGGFASANLKIEITAASLMKLYYVNSAGIYILIEDITDYLRGDLDTYQYIKLVADTTNGEYIRIYFNDRIIEMPGVACLVVGSTQKHSIFFISYQAVTAVVQDIYIDNVIITADES